MSVYTHIDSGSIVILRVCMPTDNKFTNKRFIVVGGNKFLLIKINTEKNQTSIGKKMREFQFKIQQKSYPNALDYDSYVDCGTVWILLSEQEALTQINADNWRLTGEQLSDDHKNEILRLAEKSKSISNIQRQTIKEYFFGKVIQTK